MEGADDRVISASGRVAEAVFRVAVIRPTAKLTGMLLLLVLKASLNAVNRQMNDGGVSLKKLNKSGQALDKQEVEPEKFKDIKRQLRKNGVEFSPQADPLNPEKIHLYFKAKDHATVKHALEKVIQQKMTHKQKKTLKPSKEQSKKQTKQRKKQPQNVVNLSKKKIPIKGSLKR